MKEYTIYIFKNIYGKDGVLEIELLQRTTTFKTVLSKSRFIFCVRLTTLCLSTRQFSIAIIHANSICRIKIQTRTENSSSCISKMKQNGL